MRCLKFCFPQYIGENRKYACHNDKEQQAEIRQCIKQFDPLTYICIRHRKNNGRRHTMQNFE